MRDLFGLFLEEIVLAIRPYGLEAYRAAQIAEWMYKRNVRKFVDMVNLPKNQRSILTENFLIGTLEQIAILNSNDEMTSKFLLKFSDGALIETVLMRHSYGNSVCVSSQVGCNMGCKFCASTIQGMVRNLTAGEMLNQILYVNKQLAGINEKTNNIVIMGAGEPLANYDNVLRFIRLCHQKYCLNLSYRNITLSTAGLVPGIDRLANEGLPITLAISLHAPNNTIRSRIMPINETYPLEKVLAAADRFSEKTGRRVTYEYTLIANINDSPDNARELASLLANRLANVNLIPVNPVLESGLARPKETTIAQFERVLIAKKINVTVRRGMGLDIQAACGQLRRKILQ